MAARHRDRHPAPPNHRSTRRARGLPTYQAPDLRDAADAVDIRRCVDHWRHSIATWNTRNRHLWTLTVFLIPSVCFYCLPALSFVCYSPATRRTRLTPTAASTIDATVARLGTCTFIVASARLRRRGGRGRRASLRRPLAP
ncbi:hypothetical protein BKA62DRAFT_735600 [Auriculariales sp. MPI-PUGE-AT-0066]|nr:hypothetical protein BKA62DRAFT_735600 [Auriculariales sp. MPI-PUGE-AT-0066]